MASVQVLKPDPADKHRFVLDEDKLREILVANPAVRDNPVIVISVAGRYRTGKSFLLSLMHRYLSINYTPSANADDKEAKDKDFWAYVKEVTKSGFDWKGGCDAHTVGLWIAKEPFLVTLPDGEKANVFLMDTAGTFQTQASVRECGTVFGLATLISSVLVYNIMNNVGEDDLHNLHLFAECGKMAAEQSTQQPFQKLLFLVRDWIDGRRFPFGGEGGKTFLKKVLDEEEGDSAPDEVKYVRHFLKSSFQELDCFLLPRPGDEVADAVSLQECNFDAVKPTFKENILKLIQQVLDPSNLIIKETIPGCSVNGQQMFLMFQRYLGAYNNALPEDVLSSVVQITSMLQHEAAKAKAFQAFTEGAKKIEVILRKYKTMVELEEALDPVIHFSLDKFNSAPKIGDETITSRYVSELKERIEEVTVTLKNEMKIIILVNDSKEKYSEVMKPMVDDLVSVEDESTLVQAHTKIHDRLVNNFDEEEVSKTKCLEVCMRYRSELIDWMGRQIQELNRTLKSHQTAVKFSREKYRDLIAQLTLEIDSIKSEDEFAKKIQRFKSQAVTVFDEFDKGGTEDVSNSYKEAMLKQMEPESHEAEALMHHVIQYNLHTESHSKDMTKLKLELTKTDSESLKKMCCKSHLDTLHKFDEKVGTLAGGDEMHSKYRDKLVAWINEQTNEAVEILETHVEAVDEAMKFLNKEISYIQAAMADYTENQFHTRTSFLNNDITKLFNKFKKREDKIATVQFLDLLDVRIEERVEKLILERKHIFKVHEAKAIYQQHQEKLKYELVQYENVEDLKSRHEELVKQTLVIYDTFMADDAELHVQYHAELEKWLRDQLEELLLIRDSHRKAQNTALFFFVEAIKEAETSLDRVMTSFDELQFKLQRIKSDALSRFDSADKRGEPEIAEQYRQEVKATIAVSVNMVIAKHQHISAHETSLKSFQDGMGRLQIRMSHFKTMEELEAAYKAHEEQALTQFLTGCPDGDGEYKDYSDKYSTDLINEMTLAWNDISYEMQCLLAKRDGENFCTKAVESIMEQIKNIKTQKDLEKLLKPVKQKTDLLYKGIEKAAKTDKSLESYNKYDTELENFIGDNFKKLGQCYKDHQLLKEATSGAVEKYRKLMEPVMRKKWIDVADHAEDFAWAQKLALSAFDEISATTEIERNFEVPHDLKIEYMDELKKKLDAEAEELQNQRYRTNFYNGVIVMCGVFLVSATCFNLETIISLLLIAACLGGGYLYLNKQNLAKLSGAEDKSGKSKTKSTEGKADAERKTQRKPSPPKDSAPIAKEESANSAKTESVADTEVGNTADDQPVVVKSESKDDTMTANVTPTASQDKDKVGENVVKPDTGSATAPSIESVAKVEETKPPPQKALIDDILPD